MREEYDFTSAVRGTHAGRYEEGVEVRILDEHNGKDGSGDIEAAGLVRLDPDVMAIFPDSITVNQALRVLMRDAEKMQELRKAS